LQNLTDRLSFAGQFEVSSEHDSVNWLKLKSGQNSNNRLCTNAAANVGANIAISHVIISKIFTNLNWRETVKKDTQIETSA